MKQEEQGFMLGAAYLIDDILGLDRFPALGNPQWDKNSTNDGILYQPIVSPEQWIAPWQDCTEKELCRPCWVWGGYENPTFVLSQPSSTLFVELLGLICVIGGVRFYLAWSNKVTSNLNFSRLLFGLGMIAWGLGAILAGLSYEALEWELKCRNRQGYCVKYSWLEVAYVLLQVVSGDFLLLASALSTDLVTVPWFWRLYWVGIFNFLLYSIVVGVGALLGVYAFVGFNVCLLFCIPCFVVGIGLSFFTFIYYWYIGDPRAQREEYKYQFVSWCWCIFSFVFYYAFYRWGIEKEIWADYGLWITANDFLHVILIVWAVRVTLRPDVVNDSIVLRNNLSQIIALPVASTKTKTS